MTAFEHIRQWPTSVTEIPLGCTGVHESTLRAYQILEKVKDWLHQGVPGNVVLELIAELEGSP